MIFYSGLLLRAKPVDLAQYGFYAAGAFLPGTEVGAQKTRVVEFVGFRAVVVKVQGFFPWPSPCLAGKVDFVPVVEHHFVKWVVVAAYCHVAGQQPNFLQQLFVLFFV